MVKIEEEEEDEDEDEVEKYDSLQTTFVEMNVID